MADKKTTSTTNRADKVAGKTKTENSSSSVKAKKVATKPVKVTKPVREPNRSKASAPAQTAPQTIVQQNPAPVKSGNGLSIFALLLSLGALGASGYLVYSNTLANSANKTDMAVGLTQIGNDVERIGDVVLTLKSDVDKMVEKQSTFSTSDAVDLQLQTNMAPIQEQQVAISQSLESVRQQVSGDDSSYVLSRIGRLLEAANVELNLSKNSESAIRALLLAEEQIVSSNNRSLDVVRAKILADVSALKASKKADLTAISAKIMAVNSVIESLPLQHDSKEEAVENEAVETENSESTGFFDEFKIVAKQMVDDAIQVKKIDDSAKPLLAPEQRYFLIQNLRLQLLTAQNAALQGEQAVYEQNLSSAIQWIKEYFDLTSQPVTDAVKSLDEISGVVLRPEVHDISSTLKSFIDVTANPNKG